MVESCIVIVFLCLLFVGLFQLVHAYVAREVLYHAAACGARAKTVGFNLWMVKKATRVAAIPNAGTLITPAISTVDPTLVNALATKSPGALWDFALKSTPSSPTLAVELKRLPFYMESDKGAEDSVLKYKDWDTIADPIITSSASLVLDPSSAGTVTVQVKQPYKLLLALEALAAGKLGAPGNATDITLSANYTIEAHYPLYLDDNNW